MEGHAAISTFDYIGKDPRTAPLLKEMRNPDGTPRVCHKVWMSYLTGPYDGSAKIFAQMDQAFAAANLKLMKKL